MSAAAGPAGVTVVIPTHRERGFIDSTVASVRRNMRDGDAIVIVPNGSTPEYVASLGRFADGATRVHPLERGGVAFARNAGLALATTALVVFLDDDDDLADGGLEALRAALDANPEWIGVTGNVESFQDGSGVCGRYPDAPERITTAKLLHNCILSPGAAMLRTSAVRVAGGFRQGYAPTEDYDFWARVTGAGRVMGLDVPALRYRVHDGGVSRNARSMSRAAARVFSEHAVVFRNRNDAAAGVAAARHVAYTYNVRLRRSIVGHLRAGRSVEAVRDLAAVARMKLLVTRELAASLRYR